MRRCALRSHTGEVCGAMLTRTRCESHTHADTLASLSCACMHAYHPLFAPESLSSRIRARGLAPRSREDLVCDLDAGLETPQCACSSGIEVMVLDDEDRGREQTGIDKKDRDDQDDKVLEMRTWDVPLHLQYSHCYKCAMKRSVNSSKVRMCTYSGDQQRY